MRDLHREAWGSRGSGVQVIFVSEIARSATVLHQPLIEPDDVKWRANAFVRMDDDVSQFGTHTPRKKLLACSVARIIAFSSSCSSSRKSRSSFLCRPW
jgi:hypothetical protein